MKWLIGILVLVLIFLVFFVNNGDDNMTEFKIETLEEGSGDQVVKSGDTITVHYTGTLVDGTKFDSSVDRGEPFTFTIGSGQVIQGWEQGFSGMKVGEKRRLTIPPEMGYGDRATGSIPANSVLIFEVELISIS
jgi:FKBP-type peptidyl-prolyl cis-trans isomerase